jgi:NADH-quinone oxidoreductase subunit G
MPLRGEWRLIPVHHIFGSEELSRLSPGIRQLSPQPYLLLNRDEAAALDIEEGARVALETDGQRLDLPAKLSSELAPGTAGWPAGLPGLSGLAASAWGKITKVTI